MPTIKFSFWANGILAVAALLFVLGFASNEIQGDGSGGGFIAIGVLCLVFWLIVQVLQNVDFDF